MASRAFAPILFSIVVLCIISFSAAFEDHVPYVLKKLSTRSIDDKSSRSPLASVDDSDFSQSLMDLDTLSFKPSSRHLNAADFNEKEIESVLLLENYQPPTVETTEKYAEMETY
eukprot:CAMPEP_0184643918 /NCGR_PEP_ID=MMETSP0308-20130426/731_1 /TAXON_ID=38269 /ORGANISM="Gloeochaete witrockiana, Strain SAG 46.84" /LENGTH=113 /DNA_ID=CAMNT_0027072175 /DNA_START=179 /DNA_END=520 /DNA_ORIENTATION=-